MAMLLEKQETKQHHAKEKEMASWQERAKVTAQALVVAAGSAYNVATGDIRKAAFDIAKGYGTTTSRQIEDEIKRHIRK